MVMCWRFHIPCHYRQMLFWVSGRICGEEREKTTKKEGHAKMKQVPLQGTTPLLTWQVNHKPDNQVLYRMVYHLESWTWCFPSGPEKTHSGGGVHTAPSQINQLKKAQRREEVPIDGVVLSSKDLQVPSGPQLKRAGSVGQTPSTYHFTVSTTHNSEKQH